MRVGITAFYLLLSAPAFLPVPTWAAETEIWSLHGQATLVEQYHPAFKSAYLGPNSLDPESAGRETVDLTLYAGLRLWQGGEAYANPEIDQEYCGDWSQCRQCIFSAGQL